MRLKVGDKVLHKGGGDLIGRIDKIQNGSVPYIVIWDSHKHLALAYGEADLVKYKKKILKVKLP